MTYKLKLGLAALSLLLVSGSALRAEDDNRLDDAWKAAMEDPEGVLTPAQVSGLNILAYESAAARVCDDIKLDEVKFAKAVTELVRGGEKLTDEEQVHRLSAVLFRLGTANGLFIAEGSMKKDAFCAEAAEQKADKEHKHNWQ